MKTAWVTGATGFIGGAIARRLLDEGWQVRVLARRPEKAEALALLGADLFQGDVRKPATLDASLDGVDAAFHCAAIVDLLRKDPTKLIQTNVDGTSAVLGALERAHVPRVLYLSSVAAIGREFPRADESCWHSGNDYSTPYEESKHKSERVALDFGRQGMNIVHVLPSVVIGPGDPKTGAVLKAYLRRKAPFIPNVNGAINMVHIDDLVDGIMLAFEKGQANERYIFNQAAWTVHQILAELEGITNVAPPRKIPYPVAYAGAALEELRAGLLGSQPRATRQTLRLAGRRYEYASNRAKTELGWKPKPFKNRFRDTVAYWQREVESPDEQP